MFPPVEDSLPIGYVVIKDLCTNTFASFQPFDPDISPASDGRGPYHDLLTVTDGNTTLHDASETKDAVSELPLEEDEGFKKVSSIKRSSSSSKCPRSYE